jgi:hypothetical protein
MAANEGLCMKLKVQHVMDATLVITRIINEARPMPQKGKYRLARMHARLVPEFAMINSQRDEMIRAYGTHQTRTITDGAGVESTIETEDFVVPADKMPEFTEAWAKIGAEDIELDIEPIPLDQLDLGPAVDGAIEASELIALGDLVRV